MNKVDGSFFLSVIGSDMHDYHHIMITGVAYQYLVISILFIHVLG